MKNYYLILIEHFVGIGYSILFLIGFFTDNMVFYQIGGIGMLIFMFIMIKGQPKKLSTFLFASLIGCVIGYFTAKWWIGLFWVSLFFTSGQWFGMIALIRNKNQIKNMNLSNFPMSGMKSDQDKLELIEILFFIGLIIAPYSFANTAVADNSKINPLEQEIKQQVRLMEKSKEYSNLGVQIINLNDSTIISQNKIAHYKEFLKKSIKEAKKVDTSVLNKILKGYGTVYYEKYIVGKELELKGYETGNSSFLSRGQILYDEFVDWENEKFNETQ